MLAGNGQFGIGNVLFFIGNGYFRTRADGIIFFNGWRDRGAKMLKLEIEARKNIYNNVQAFHLISLLTFF